MAEEGFEPEFGARPLRRTLQRRVYNHLSPMVLAGTLNRGGKVVVVGLQHVDLTFEVVEGAATTDNVKGG